jgi:CHAD domain
MARAGRVKGIHPKSSLRSNALKVVATRLDELYAWRHCLNDSELVQDLHDMRIAAKRLRYALEMFDVCFPDVKPLLKELTEMQESLGTIHDLDVFNDLLRGMLAHQESAIEDGAREIMRSEATPVVQSRELRRMLSAQARNRERVGLIGLIGDKSVQREREFDRMQQRWRGDPLDEFRQRLLQLTGLEPAPSLDSLVVDPPVALPN